MQLMWGVMGRGVLPEMSNDQKLLYRSCYVIPMYSGSRHSYRGDNGKNSAGRIPNRFWSIVN